MKFSTRIQAKLKSHNLNLVPARVTCRPTCSGLEGMATGDHLRAFAQRFEVADGEVRIMGSKSELLRTFVAASNGTSAMFGVL